MKCTCTDAETDLQGVEDELKPLAIIYSSKTPLQYREACRSPFIKHRVLVRAGVVAVALEAQTIRSYVGLVANRKFYTRAQYQRCMGKLLGYENHDVENFIQSEIGLTCTCVECGGEL